MLWWINFGLAYLMVLLGGIRGECSNPYLVMSYIVTCVHLYAITIVYECAYLVYCILACGSVFNCMCDFSVHAVIICVVVLSIN